MGSKIDKFLILSGAITSVYIFAAILILGSLYPGYSHTENYISELGAVDSPVMNQANFFLFFITGMFWTMFSIGLLRTFKNSWAGKIGAIILLTSGLSFSMVAFFPCDAGCKNFTVTGGLHQITSDVPVYLSLISLFFFAYEARKGEVIGKEWMYAFLIVAFVTAPVGYIYLGVDSPDGPVYQRLTIAIPFILMAAVSVYLYRRQFRSK